MSEAPRSSLSLKYPEFPAIDGEKFSRFFALDVSKANAIIIITSIMVFSLSLVT